MATPENAYEKALREAAERQKQYEEEQRKRQERNDKIHDLKYKKTRYSRVGILAVVLVFVLIIPATSLVVYQFGGYYNDKVLPLNQANQYLTTAQDTVAGNMYAMQTALSYIQLAEARINASDISAGVGNGSPCWLWVTPTQTYGYVYLLLSNITSNMHTFIAKYDNASVNNANGLNTLAAALAYSIFTRIGDVNNAIVNTPGGDVNNGDSNIGNCLFIGNKVGTLEFVGDLVAFIVLIGAVPVTIVYTYNRQIDKLELIS